MLSRIRVLDCTNRLGWIAGRILADLGADVIKVERPDADVADPVWQAHNLNKRRLSLDLGAPSGRRVLPDLVAGADILLECAVPGTVEARRFEHQRLRQHNGGLIQVSITPFGRSGPRADWAASDIELMAAGGAMSLAGEADGMPVRITVPQSGGWAGATAATGALTALHARERTGRGQLVDVSAQAAIIAALANAPTFWDLERTIPMRAGAFITGRSLAGARYRVFWPCRDGYINFILYGGNAGRRTNEALVSWMREAGVRLGALGGIDWSSFSPTELDQAQVDAIEEPIGRFMRGLTKREFLDGACEREMLGYPVSTVADIAADPQLAERQYWTEVLDGGGSMRRFCGGFGVVDGERMKIRHTPVEAALSARDVLAELDRRSASGRDEGERPSRSRSGTQAIRALSDVKVVVFGGYAAGPWIGKVLANFGARVVHVESKDRPDGFRLEYPPFKDGERGINRGGTFAFFNDSKYGITLDVKKPSGVELARRLTDWCDILIENMRPGVMARIGLGYDALVETNPELIQLSTCNMGQTGPRARTPGFGSQLSAMAGFCGLAGEPDGPPMLLYGPYIDFIAALYGTSAVLAALEHRDETGKGVRIDISQYECGVSFLAGAILDYHLCGAIAERRGNEDPCAAPHGAYACAEDEWLTLSCWSDAEFDRLAAVLGKAHWSADERFASLAARQEHGARIDAAISAWCVARRAEAAARILQASGVHAYPVNTVADLFSDPQLVHRNTWRVRRHPIIGDQAYYFPGFDLLDTPGDVTSPAPLLGADNERVYREFLGLTAADIHRYRAVGVIG